MSAELWLAIAAVGIATYLIRASFIVTAERVAMPPLARRSLRFIPLAVLPALAVPEVVRVEPADPLAVVARIAAAAIAAVVAWRTRSLPASIAVGLAILLALQVAGARVG